MKSRLQQRVDEALARAIIGLTRHRQPHSAHNPYLEGAYAPLREEYTETALRITGELPPELNGTLLRIGPNPMDVPNPGAQHWFLGDGMVHGLRLREGRAVWYRNRWIGSASVNRRLGRPPVPGEWRGLYDTVNTHVIGHSGRQWALVEGGALPVELGAELQSLRHGLFDSPLRQGYSAHPHLDPETGELHAVCYDGLERDRLQYLVIDAQCQLIRRVEIPVRHGPMVHDCALSRRYAVVLDLPVTFSWRSLLGGEPFPFRWNPRHTARVGLLPREGGADEVRWCEVEPCYVFHTCNAWDEADGSVGLYAVVHDRMFDRRHVGPDGARLTLERWRIDPAAGSVKREVVSDRAQEFPRFDERQALKPQRYLYAAGVDAGAPALGSQQLIWHDLARGETRVRTHGAGRLASEAVFVPRAADAPEGEGWLLYYLYRPEDDGSDLVVLDALDPTGAPAAIVHLPRRVPLGFHGSWLPDPITNSG